MVRHEIGEKLPNLPLPFAWRTPTDETVKGRNLPESQEPCSSHLKPRRGSRSTDGLSSPAAARRPRRGRGFAMKAFAGDAEGSQTGERALVRGVRLEPLGCLMKMKRCAASKASLGYWQFNQQGETKRGPPVDVGWFLAIQWRIGTHVLEILEANEAAATRAASSVSTGYFSPTPESQGRLRLDQQGQCHKQHELRNRVPSLKKMIARAAGALSEGARQGAGFPVTREPQWAYSAHFSTAVTVHWGNDRV